MRWLIDRERGEDCYRRLDLQAMSAIGLRTSYARQTVDCVLTADVSPDTEIASREARLGMKQRNPPGKEWRLMLVNRFRVKPTCPA